MVNLLSLLVAHIKAQTAIKIEKTLLVHCSYNNNITSDRLSENNVLKTEKVTDDRNIFSVSECDTTVGLLST